ncbi:MAG: YbbR-like domain-containing protein [Bacteroidota bacterium]|nr:YbbR-like domain-containing protein [Bacteroidota bacterium]
MKKYLKEILEIFTIENIMKQRKLLVYFVFVLIASVFWLLIALGKNYDTEILYPVRFANLPKDKVLINKLPQYLNLSVDAYGFTLLRYKVKRSILPIYIDMRKNNLFHVQGKDNKYFLLTRYLTKQVSKRMSDDVRIISIQPDSIVFDFSEMTEKKVAVIPDIKFSLEKQYLIKQKPRCKPDSIVISGTNSVLDTINNMYTKKLDLETLNKNITRNVGVRSIEGVVLSEKKVELSIVIEKYTEGSISLPIEVKNLPDSLLLKTFPDKIDLSYKVALSDYPKVKPYQFKLMVDYNDFISGQENNFQKMRVELKRFPSYVHSIRYSPKYVDYLFEKK